MTDIYIYSKEQIEAIKSTIEIMLEKAREHISALDDICDEDYLKGRSRYPISAIVYSGFDIEKKVIPGFTIQKIQYGKGRFMPELYNSKVVVQLYGETSDFCNTEEVRNKIRAWGARYQIIQFTIDKESYSLEKLEQITFKGINRNNNRAIKNNNVVLYDADSLLSKSSV